MASWLKWQIDCVDAKWRDELTHLEKYFNHPQRMLKNGDSTTVIAETILGQQVVIKRYNSINLWHRLRKSLVRSRAEHCWHNANILQNLAIDTPQPIASVVRRFGMLRGTAYLVCAWIDGVDALQFFTLPGSEKNSVAEKIVQDLKKLNQAKIAHGDLKATNIILKNNKVYFIDLDAMREYRCAYRWRRASAKDKWRFMKNWRNTIAETLFRQLMVKYELL